ncbi:PREDICTED: uncharacterized protein LOC108562384 [Nicrophorus vespilloides]|uniref:Uncharacterized protein LOC108562384 n=1 Tax=Nicrophorus vespilloides TaxID=110193 RepID=A0ABM1MNN6_NICVS|nr:PREDICTED: uncharacterized protein LOC108562384 [Nicrophorus vespilloides]
MIKFKFGVLLCIPEMPKASEKKGKSKRNKSKREKSKDSKRSKSKDSKRSKSKDSKKTKASSVEVQKPEYLYEVDKPLGFIHIDYNLLPNMSYSVDVVYWETVYKIFTADESVAFTSCKRDGAIWIGVVVEHRVEDLEQDELLQLQKHVIQCTASPSKNKVGQSARSEKTKAFYVRANEMETKGFLEAFDQDPNVEEIAPISRKTICSDKLIFERMLRILETGDYSFKEFTPNTLESLPEDFCPEEVIQLVELPKEEKRDKKGKKGKKGKKERKKSKKSKKEKKKVNLKMSLSGESFFTDSNLCVHGTKETMDKIQKMYVLTRVKDLMTVEAQAEMNPLVIKLKMVKNLPVEILQKEGFTSLYLQYNVPNIARATTLEKEIVKDIRILDAHVYFNLDAHVLIEFLQTRRFCVELVGTRMKPEIEPSLFHPDCKFSYKKFVDEDETVVVLGTACFDLSQLLDHIQMLKLVEAFRSPDNLQAMDVDRLYRNFDYPIGPTLNKIHLDPTTNFKGYTPLKDTDLLTHGTSLKIEVFLGAPLYGISQMLATPEFFRRLLLIVYKEEVAVVLLNEILSQNQDLTQEVIVCNYMQIQDGNNLDTTSELVTGFMIDNGNSYLFFIEASMKNYCLEMIWMQIKVLNESACKMLYSTNYVYSRRIYEKFLSIGGLFTIALKIPLQEIFRIKDIYLEGNLPKPCFKALMKLQMLLKTPTMREINQYCLFPTANELISLNVEFGVPVKIKTLQ